MNALTNAGPINSASSALVPRNMQDAMALATMMAKAGFLAKELQNPGGAMFVIEQSMRWNMSPFAVAMETSFIQGKPMFSGKIVAAAVVSSGTLAGRLSYEYSGGGDDRTVIVRGILRGEEEPRTVSVRVRDAKTTNKVWQTQPDQQLAYHGARVFARRHCPEVMLGVYAPEEFDDGPAPRDVPNITPAEPGSPAAKMLALQAPVGTALPLLGPDGVLYQIQQSGDRPAVVVWMSAARKAIAKLEDAPALRLWRHNMGQYLAQVSEDEPEAVKAVEDAWQKRLALLAPPVDPEPEEEPEDDFPGTVPETAA